MEKYNIIFLDIDGVLNSTNYMIKVYNETGKRWSSEKNLVDPYCLNLLRGLVEEFDAYIVITSTIRKNEKLLNIFYNMIKSEIPLNRFIGVTKSLPNQSRGIEIEEYINKHDYLINNFVAFDDDGDLDNLGDNFIQTQNKFGLQEEDIFKAKSIFQNKTKTR